MAVSPLAAQTGNAADGSGISCLGKQNFLFNYS